MNDWRNLYREWGRFDIVSDRGPDITLNFWSRKEQDDLEAQLLGTPGAQYRLLNNHGVCVRKVEVGNNL